jgi:hypothetical protein
MANNSIEFPDIEELTNKVLKKVAQLEARSLRRGTETWNNKPTFSVQQSATGYQVVTTDQQWLWVNFGTPPHTIAPRNAKVLAYRGDFTPKTRPGFVGSRAGGKTGEFVFRGPVQHPGVEARRFDERNLEKLDERIDREIEKMLENL